MKKNMIFIVGAVAIIVACILISTFASDKGKELTYEEDLLNINFEVEGNEATLDKYKTENPVVAMYIEKYGAVVMELYPDIAPNTVNNFISLVKSGFYDNNTFHRLMKGFVLQGGDPSGNGSGGPGYTIKGEFSDNGVENNLLHEKMVVSMARGQENDSAGSQFFIMLEKNEYLDGKYAAFGKVIDGWDNIEKIASTEVVADEASGQLKTNLVLKKAIVDMKGKAFEEVKKN